jgi:cysteinyl-tRNA synthetase
MQKYSGAQLRMFMLSSHYKKPIDFSEDEMLMAKSKLERLENTLLRIQEQNKSILIEQTDENALTALKAKIKDTSAKFEAAMGDDFNTALAIGAVFELVKDINIFIDNNLKAKNSCQVLNEAQEVITTIITAVMGIELNLGKNAAGDLSAELIELLLKIRWEAKQDKNWHLADQIRISLEEMGIVLKDAKDKTYWSINH